MSKPTQPIIYSSSVIKLMNPPELRVEITETGVKVTTFVADDPEDFGLESTYSSVDKMPYWVQTKLIKLQMLPIPPPRIDVENIGSRIGQGTFWVSANRTGENK